MRWILIVSLWACAGPQQPARDYEYAEPATERALAPRDDLGPTFHVPLDNSPRLGPSDALITVVAFTDFECRFCARALATLQALRERYGDDLRIVFRHFPLSFHRRALAAHEVAQEVFHADGDEAFWRFHDLLFADRDNLDPERLDALGGPHADVLNDHRHRTTIEADIELGRRLGVRGTPTFFFNGRRLSGARPLEEMIVFANDAAVRARIAIDEGASAETAYDRIVADGLREEPVVDAVASDVLPARPPVPAHAPRRGSEDEDALVIQMFSDLECRFCARAMATVQRVLETYPNVAVVFRHMPLRSHRHARTAANAAIEVRAVGGDEMFWAFHDRVLEHYDDLELASLLATAREVGADPDRVERAVRESAHGRVIDADLRTARAVGASGTPTFVIGDRVLRGARPFLEFEEIIDSMLDPDDVE